MKLYSGCIIRIGPNYERVVYEDAQSARKDTPYGNADKIGQCALDKRQNHDGFQWEYEKADDTV